MGEYDSAGPDYSSQAFLSVDDLKRKQADLEADRLNIDNSPDEDDPVGRAFKLRQIQDEIAAIQYRIIGQSATVIELSNQTTIPPPSASPPE